MRGARRERDMASLSGRQRCGRASCCGVVPRPAVPWQCGIVDVGVRAKGPTLFCSLVGALQVEGGEARTLA